MQGTVHMPCHQVSSSVQQVHCTKGTVLVQLLSIALAQKLILAGVQIQKETTPLNNTNYLTVASVATETDDKSWGHFSKRTAFVELHLSTLNAYNPMEMCLCMQCYSLPVVICTLDDLCNQNQQMFHQFAMDRTHGK